MTAPIFATATPFQRVQMLEEALAKVLDRDGMEIATSTDPSDLFVWVQGGPEHDEEVGHSLNAIARELEALLP